MKMYPVNAPVCPAAVSSSDSRTVHVEPAASVPSEDRPMPGLTVLLVVSVNAVPAPDAARGKKLSLIEPACAVAPPVAAPNGSAVVLANDTPVSNAPSRTANGTSRVVLAGEIVAITAGPTCWSENRGNDEVSTTCVSMSKPTPTGAIVADTVMLPAVNDPLLGTTMLDTLI